MSNLAATYRQRILGVTTLAKTSFPDIWKDCPHSFAKLSHADSIKVMIRGKWSTTHYYNLIH